MFYVIMTPIGVLMRISGKDMLRMKLDPQAESYWIDVSGEAQRSTMNQQF